MCTSTRTVLLDWNYLSPRIFFITTICFQVKSHKPLNHTDHHFLRSHFLPFWCYMVMDAMGRCYQKMNLVNMHGTYCKYNLLTVVLHVFWCKDHVRLYSIFMFLRLFPFFASSLYSVVLLDRSLVGYFVQNWIVASCWDDREHPLMQISLLNLLPKVKNTKSKWFSFTQGLLRFIYV